MRLVIISAAFPPQDSGEADHALKYCRRLADAGLDVDLLTSQRRGLPQESTFRVHPLMRRWSWKELPRLRNFLRNQKPEAILLFYTGWIYNHHPMITLAPSLAKGLSTGVRFVTQFSHVDGARRFRIRLRDGLDVSFHLHSHLVTPFVTRVLGLPQADANFGTLLTDSDRILVMSERQRAKLLSVNPAAGPKSEIDPPPPLMNIVADPGGEHRRATREKLRLNDDDTVFAYYGYIYGGKGLETLLAAFQTIRERGVPARLLLVGGTPARGQKYGEKIRRLADTLGLRSDVIFTGECDADGDEGSLYLHSADVCVLPFDEGVELNRSSVAAAASHGLPILTTRGPELEDAFQDDENVKLVPPRDAEALATAMEALAQGPDHRRRLAEGAGRMAESLFSWDASLGRTLKALRGAVGSTDTGDRGRADAR